MNQRDKGWNIFGKKEQCFSIVIFTHDPMGFWSSLNANNERRATAAHRKISCPTVSANESALQTALQKPNAQSTSVQRGKCRQFCIQCSIFQHVDIKSNNGVTCLASKLAIKNVCTHEQCTYPSDPEGQKK